MQKPAGYFCCEPGQLGVNPTAGLNGGVCEAADQAIPTSLLATIANQVGVATPTPSSIAGGSNATTTGSSGTSETNPTEANSSSTSNGGSNENFSSISRWSLGAKVGAGIAVAVAIAIFLALCAFQRHRRANEMRIRGVDYTQYDDFGQPMQYSGLANRASVYEPIRREAPGNNVTVNVVQGDLQT